MFCFMFCSIHLCVLSLFVFCSVSHYSDTVSPLFVTNNGDTVYTVSPGFPLFPLENASQQVNVVLFENGRGGGSSEERTGELNT